MTGMRIWLAMVAVVLLAACSGGQGADSAATGEATGTVARSAAGAGQAGEELAGDDAAEEAAEMPAPDAAEGSADDDASGVGTGDDDGEALPDPPPVRPGDRIIKEGTVSVEVAEGQFDRAFTAVIAAARRLGGDAVGSTTSTSDNGDTFGSVTVRVPVETFEDLLVGIGRVGTVVSRNVDSQDVSAEYTDLQARLRHLRAQERFYLGLFDDAEDVQDAIAVQQQLDGIQGQIERLQGRQRLLDDRTSFSTLTVELFEPGAGGGIVPPEQERSERPSLAQYWDTARDAFINVVGAILVAVLFVLPLLIPVVAVWGAWLVLRRPRRVKVTPPPAEQVPEERDPVGAER